MFYRAFDKLALTGVLSSYVPLPDGMGFGRITRDDGTGDVLVHVRHRIRKVVLGTKLTFDMDMDEVLGLPVAVNVRIAHNGEPAKKCRSRKRGKKKAGLLEAPPAPA